MVEVHCPLPEYAYRVFHTLNGVGRGVDLSFIDMLKSRIFERIGTPEEKAAHGERWQDLENKLGRQQFEKLFLYVQKIDLVSSMQPN